MNGKRVIIGLSGGVDSSVAAALLIEQGYEVHGVYLECYNAPGCRTDQDKADALKVALKLGISFQVLDFRKEYKEKVIEYFYHEYEKGRTPNPDVMCNREIKFGIFYDWALRLNSFAQGYNHEPFDFVATGHYARINEVRSEKGEVKCSLQRARDESKDQSYFLWQIPRDCLKNILFPLGEMLKTEVREKAKNLKLNTANKPDSMGICFIGEVNVQKLLRDKLGEKTGKVMYQGELIGEHKGLWFSTIGSRGGWRIDPKRQGSQMKPLYVIGKNFEKNELYVGMREETMQKEFKINSKILKFEKKLWVRIRNLGELVEVSKIEDGVVVLKEKIFGLAQGQSAVFYDRDGVLVGGGIIV